VRVLAYGQTHRQTDTQTQTDFIICPMLYAIAMGQIITMSNDQATSAVESVEWTTCTLSKVADVERFFDFLFAYLLFSDIALKSAYIGM